MPMELNPDCRRRLLEVLADVLPQAMVDNGQSLRWSSLDGLSQCDDVLPSGVRTDAAQWISDTPFSTFVLGTLTAQLSREAEYASGLKTALLTLPGFTDVGGLSERLVSGFEALPSKYTFLFDMSLVAHESDTSIAHEYALGDGISFFAPGLDSAADYPLLPDEGPYTLLFLNRDAGPREWLPNHYYLKLTVSGFVEDFVTTRPVEDAVILVRCIAGLLMGSGVAYSRDQYSLVPSTSPIHVYLESSTGRQLLRSHALASEYSERIRTLRWIEVKELHGTGWPAFMKHSQERLQPALVASHEKGVIRRAAQWYFDSRCGGSQLLQFVQATVAIEILLGDKATSDVIGISELLANRCAYLLADSQGERTRILCEFKNLYDTRSQIVHRGKHRLSGAEYEQLATLRHYTRRLIRKEIDLLGGQQSRSVD